MVRIPEEYQEVEYIENTGTQYILTNYIPTITENMKIQLDYMFTATQSGESMIFGSTAGSTGIRFQCEYYNNNKWYIGSGINQFRQILPGVGKENNTRYSLFVNGETLVVDNQSISYTHKWYSSDVLPICIFAINWANIIRYPNVGIKIYKLLFTANEIKEAEFIPCYRKIDNEIGMYDTVSKTFYTNSGTGTFLKGHNVYYDSINLLEQRRKILLNTPHLKTIQDNIATFNTDIKFPLKECKIYFTPKQEGSGDPSPQNVRPISGWNEINIYHTGKNFFPIESGMRGGNANILLKANQIYTGSVKAPLTPYIRLTYINDTLSPYIWLNPINGSERSYNSFQPILDTKKVGFFLGGQLVQEMMIEKGNVIPKNFESYQSQTSINIPFSQPIYGGYVDLIKGEIVSEYCTFVLDGVNNYVTRTPQITKYGMAIAYSAFADNMYKGLENLPKGNTSLISQIKSNKYVIPINNNGGAASQQGVYFGGSNNNLYLRVAVSADKIPDTSTQTNIKNGINAWLQENPIQITYKMAEPIIYSLTPQNIIPFKGINNIFSDANGNIKIKFLAH